MKKSLLFLCIIILQYLFAEFTSAQEGNKELKRLDDLAWNYLSSSTDSAILVAEDLYDLALKENNLLYQAYAHNTRGVAYDIKGNNEKAVYWYNECLKIYRELKDERGEATSLLNIGIIYYNQGLYKKALENYQKSLSLYEKAKDKNGIATAYNNISIIFKTQKQYDEAQSYLLKCLEIQNELNDTASIAITYTNLALNYRLTGDMEKSFEFFNKAFKISQKVNDKISMATILSHIGYYYQLKEDYNKALEIYNQALNMNFETGNKSGEADVLNNIGFCYNKMKQPDKGIEYCSRGMTISLETEKNEEYSSSCFCLYESNIIKGNFEEALNYYRKYTTMQDSLVNEQTAKDIAQIEFQYKYRKKEIEDSTRNAEKEKVLRAENDAQQSELEKQTQRNIFLTVGVALLIVFGWFMYNRFKVTRKQKEIIESQKEIVESQKELVEEKNKNITDSINYALRIQKSFLPGIEQLEKLLGSHFVIYQPKDIVSGDFYWGTQADNDPNLTVFALADCTGHGVPGAMMTMIGNTLLNQTIGNSTINTPAEAMNYLRKQLPKNLKKDNTSLTIRDGMDMVMIEIDRKNMKLLFSGANNSICILRHGEFIDFKGDKQAITASEDDAKLDFSHHEFGLEKNDLIYLWTDGWPDQFGGTKEKKFKTSQLKKLLSTISNKTMKEQKTILQEELQAWMNPKSGKVFEQVDDITLIGIQI